MYNYNVYESIYFTQDIYIYIFLHKKTNSTFLIADTEQSGYTFICSNICLLKVYTRVKKLNGWVLSVPPH